MYLTQLSLKNVKLLRQVDLSFQHSDGTPRMWTVLVGENGACKTTVLRAIALVASGQTRASQLVPDATSFRDRRHLGEPVVIGGTFQFSSERHEDREYPGLLPTKPAKPPVLVSSLTLEPKSGEFSGVSGYIDQTQSGDPLVASRAQDLPLWFAAGYGVIRRLLPVSPSQTPAVLSLARLEPLFGGVDFIGPGFAELLEPSLARHYLRVLREVLLQGGVLPAAMNAIELRGRGGVRSAADLVEAHRFTQHIGDDDVKLPATWLSHGYQSMIAWVSDLVGQILLEANGPRTRRSLGDPLTEVEPEDMEGLVLIDEIDLHLHPRWQVKLIPALKSVFPRLQFVATTHSPMVLPGLERDEVLVMLQDEQGDVVVQNRDEAAKLMTGSEIYESFFGMDGLYPEALGEDLHRYGYLANNPARTDDEDHELREIRARLLAAHVDPGWEPLPRDHDGSVAAVPHT